jgi:PBSX family phage terminase large subunit
MYLHQTQGIVAEDKHRFRVINCGRRWGKTTLAVEEIKGKSVYRPSRIAYIAPTYAQARDIAWQMLVRELKPIIKKINETRLELEVMTKDGETSSIVLRGWESIETLRGQQYDLIVIDEIASMRNFWSNWQEVVRPTLTDTRGEAIFISTPKGFNHFYDLFNLESKDNDYKSYHFTSYDNPFIPKDELDKAKQELTEDRFAQEYLADFRKTEGLVYKEFDRTRHLYTSESQSGVPVEVLGGVDFGHHNPCAVLTVIRDNDNKYWVKKEWYKREQTESQIAEYVASCGFNKCYPDPESPSAIKELKVRGVNVREVIKNKDSIKVGIDKVRELFKAGRLMIHTSCENLIFELETYSYPEKKDLRNPDENPIKENDHALDALRYIFLMQAEVIMPQVRQFIPKPSYRPGYNQLIKLNS